MAGQLRSSVMRQARQGLAASTLFPGPADAWTAAGASCFAEVWQQALSGPIQPATEVPHVQPQSQQHSPSSTFMAVVSTADCATSTLSV